MTPPPARAPHATTAPLRAATRRHLLLLTRCFSSRMRSACLECEAAGAVRRAPPERGPARAERVAVDEPDQLAARAPLFLRERHEVAPASEAVAHDELRGKKRRQKQKPQSRTRCLGRHRRLAPVTEYAICVTTSRASRATGGVIKSTGGRDRQSVQPASHAAVRSGADARSSPAARCGGSERCTGRRARNSVVGSARGAEEQKLACRAVWRICVMWSTRESVKRHAPHALTRAFASTIAATRSAATRSRAARIAYSRIPWNPRNACSPRHCPSSTPPPSSSSSTTSSTASSAVADEIINDDDRRPQPAAANNARRQ